MKVVNNDGGKDCLPGSWNAWTEQRLLACLQPSLILCGVQKPFASSCLSPTDEVVLLRCKVDWCDPVENGLLLFATLSIVLTLVQPIHSFFRCQDYLTE